MFQQESEEEKEEGHAEKKVSIKDLQTHMSVQKREKHFDS